MASQSARFIKLPILSNQTKYTEHLSVKKIFKEKPTLRKLSRYIASFLVCAFVLTVGIAMGRTQAGSPNGYEAGYTAAHEAAISAEPAAATPAAAELAGLYEGDDGGAYYIRQIGTKV